VAAIGQPLRGDANALRTGRLRPRSWHCRSGIKIPLRSVLRVASRRWLLRGCAAGVL